MAHPAIPGTPIGTSATAAWFPAVVATAAPGAGVVPGYAGGPLAASPLEAAISCRQTAGVLATAVRVRTA